MAPVSTPASTSKHKSQDSARRSTPRQPLSVPERLRRLFTSLCAQIDGAHFTNAIKTCEKILRLDPTDVDARHTRLFLLLQTEQYDAALSFVDSDETGSNHAYQRAYSLYRLQNEHEARKVLNDIKGEKGDGDRSLMHLEAQLGYREGLYAEAVEIYNALLESADPDSEEYSDVFTNLQAAQKHLDFVTTGFRHVLDTFPLSLATTLESNPPPAPPGNPITATLSTAPPTAHAPQFDKKVRKSRVPLGVVPGVTPLPDPERWLKKSERSTFRQGKKRRGPGGGGATQGSSNVDPPSSSAPASQNKSSGGKGKKRK